MAINGGRRSSKYKLTEDFQAIIGVKPDKDIQTPFISLNREGLLIVRNGYEWNGAPCVIFNVKRLKRASLVHDALYELMRCHLLPDYCKPIADKSLALLGMDDGMPRLIANFVYCVARIRCSPHTLPKLQHITQVNMVNS